MLSCVWNPSNIRTVYLSSWNEKIFVRFILYLQSVKAIDKGKFLQFLNEESETLFNLICMYKISLIVYWVENIY